MSTGSAAGSSEGAAEYRLRPAYGVRVLGAGFVLAAVFVVVFSLAGTDSGLVSIIAYVGASVAALLVLGGAILTFYRPPLLVLDDSGLTNRSGRGVGLRRVEWKEVADVARSGGPGGQVLVVRLSDGRTTKINLGVLEARSGDIEEVIRVRANRALGYRPL